ncbi:uncharacterized protein LOC120260309 isoform X1 [Dioscorea cayenensis subsp. rotundata]|uniref:Uncharacterized protein LOC120260309 isoform X1 n=1 Tax=Dioscorea cayennensis subsp. rotundata TaxID=55577 RepID=A0AB40B9M6_DIOCR|nr:uncharacterized protein LOC120260309 isoform X1 [Dioscorea cayenensis subsp. rotundata]
MVKLATSRECRAYSLRRSRNRWEYINAALYVFAAVLLLGGSAAQFSSQDAKSGLVILLIGITTVALVNVHDLVAHLAGIDYCLSLAALDVQLLLVEFAVPLVHLLGSILFFLSILFFFIQTEKGYNYRLEKYAMSMLIVGPVFWLIGSIHDACQIYERADGQLQILQKSVQVPSLFGSLLFLVGGIFNKHESHEFKILGRSWTWLSIFGSLLFIVGGLMNVVKVFKMQQMDGLGLEKLRGGAQERLSRNREGRIPLILEENTRRKKPVVHPREETRPVPVPVPVQAPAPLPVPTPYKDVLLSNQA